MALAPLPTTMDVDPATGTFGLCFGDDCANSLSVSLYQVSVDTNIDFILNELNSSTVLADFTELDPTDLDNDGYDDPMVARPDGNMSWTSGTVYALTCLTTQCNPRASNASEFVDMMMGAREDAIGIKLGFEHIAEDAIKSTRLTSRTTSRAARCASSSKSLWPH